MIVTWLANDQTKVTHGKIGQIADVVGYIQMLYSPRSFVTFKQKMESITLEIYNTDSL